MLLRYHLHGETFVKVAFLTIGQSPREDIMADIRRYLKGIKYVEYGVLDGLTLEEIEKEFKPLPEDFAYVSRLRDGSEVKLSKSKVSMKLQDLISRIEESVDLIVILCTGDFNLKSRKPIIYPSQALIDKIKSLSPKTIGVVVPLESQISMARKRWGNVAKVINVIVWSPYSGTIEDLVGLAHLIEDAEIIVMDCLGYSVKHKEILERVTHKKVITPREVVAELITKVSRVS